jgi:hypothetical protein
MEDSELAITVASKVQALAGHRDESGSFCGALFDTGRSTDKQGEALSPCPRWKLKVVDEERPPGSLTLELSVSEHCAAEGFEAGVPPGVERQEPKPPGDQDRQRGSEPDGAREVDLALKLGGERRIDDDLLLEKRSDIVSLWAEVDEARERVDHVRGEHASVKGRRGLSEQREPTEYPPDDRMKSIDVFGCGEASLVE